MRKLTQETYDRRSASGAYHMTVVLEIVWYQTIFRYGERTTKRKIRERNTRYAQDGKYGWAKLHLYLSKFV